jgi:mannose-6-phosphate isomerase-like protein (cupin superfamily)
LISIPTQAFRGFENIGEDIGFLWAVLGGDEPGRVLWAPRVFEMAQDFGLALLDDGSLIDLAAGEVIPSGKALLPPTTLEQMAKLTKLSDEDLESHCVRAPADAEIKDCQPPSIETLVGPGSGHNWYHGFTVERVTIPTGQALSAERFDGSEVWFVADGKALIIANSEEAEVGPGDTATVPSQSLRSLRCIGEKPAVLVRVRGLS